MQVITALEQVVLDIAGVQGYKNKIYRLLKWTLCVPYDMGIVINNYMSGELIYISIDELKSYLSEGELRGLSKLIESNIHSKTCDVNSEKINASKIESHTDRNNDTNIAESYSKKTQQDTFSDATALQVDIAIRDILNSALSKRNLDTSDDLLSHLLAHWFVVPLNYDEKNLVEELRLACKLINKKRGVTSYKILTTTRCNARCFYCYEHGIRYSDMTEETARKIVDYIARHHNGRQVTLSWFGGEPLMRPDIIDIICDGLAARDIEYASVMISNGYIFNDELIERAHTKWKLKNLQITLDGTREVYNKAKNYYSEHDTGIYNYTSTYVDEPISAQPYDRVIRNIHKLVANDIKVNIRLNLGAYNYKNLDELIDVLGQEYADENGVTAYVGGLFEELEQDEAIKKDLVNNIIKLSDKISSLGLGSYTKSGLKLRISGCMADNDNHRGFSPDGLIIKCEHFIEDRTIGCIDSDEIDMSVLNEWKERETEGAECDLCPAYPACYKLKNCPVSHACSISERDEFISQNKRTILHELRKFKAHQETTDEQIDELENC